VSASVVNHSLTLPSDHLALIYLVNRGPFWTGSGQATVPAVPASTIGAWLSLTCVSADSGRRWRTSSTTARRQSSLEALNEADNDAVHWLQTTATKAFVKWTCSPTQVTYSTLAPASTWFTYPRGMEDWVDLGATVTPAGRLLAVQTTHNVSTHTDTTAVTWQSMFTVY